MTAIFRWMMAGLRRLKPRAQRTRPVDASSGARFCLLPKKDPLAFAEHPVDVPNTYQGTLAPARNGREPRSGADYRPVVFDPALQHIAAGLRLGEAQFGDPGQRAAYISARRSVTQHALNRMATTRWHANLVMRGSLLLKQYLSEAAREPADIDWVVRPPTLEPRDTEARLMLREIIDAIGQAPKIGDVLIDIKNTNVDVTWGYSDTPGRRVVFPWRAANLPAGELQMDFTFGEPLPEAPRMITLLGVDQDVFAASPELSLAWKIIWLAADAYPQPKDLYDATLLAERYPITRDYLESIVALHRDDWVRDSLLDTLTQKPAGGPLQTLVDDSHWRDFQREYPAIEGTASEWLTRLNNALAPLAQQVK